MGIKKKKIINILLQNGDKEKVNNKYSFAKWDKEKENNKYSLAKWELRKRK
jgi:hypothetical protein